MSLFRELIEATLTESTALTKGSQRVMNDPKLVTGIADSLRDDVRTNPSTFPPDSKTTFKKASDQDLAQWFLENLDKIEKQGYEGTIYSRDGVNNEWLARKYISGAHSWEDIIGVANMNLRDWYSMKNRFLTKTETNDEGQETEIPVLDKNGKKIPMLDPNHQDLWKFNGVRDLGKYISTHYHELLQKVRDASKLAAIKKSSKSIKLVDNDDYKIYTVFNWAGARTLGNGTQWCTANSEQDSNYNTYSNRAMLFQVYPKQPEMVDKIGEFYKKRSVGPEKYQFDAGTPCFHDIADDPADKEMIKKKFPYLYDDLVKGLKQHKETIESNEEKWKEDPNLQTKETTVKVYDVDAEIKKLKKLEELGYFTKKARPAPKPIEEPGMEQPQSIPISGEEPIQPVQESKIDALEPDLRGIDAFEIETIPYWVSQGVIHKDNLMVREQDLPRVIARAIASDRKNFKESNIMEEKNQPLAAQPFMNMITNRFGHDAYHILDDILWNDEDADTRSKEQKIKMVNDALSRLGAKFRVVNISQGSWVNDDPNSLFYNKKYDDYEFFHLMGTDFSNPGKRKLSSDEKARIKKDQEDTATMMNLVKGGRSPEDAEQALRNKNQGKTANVLPFKKKEKPQMEEVDKDVAAMLSNLKKYDILKESMAPVLEKKDGKKPEWLYKKEVEAEKEEGKKEVDEAKWHNQDKPEDHFKGGVEKFADKFKKKDDKEDKKVDEEAETSKTSKGGIVTKTDGGLKHKSGGAYGGDKKNDKKDKEDKEDLDEEADQDVLEWMKRFEKLGR